MLLCFAIQYIYLKTTNPEHDTSNLLGSLIGLSTILYGPMSLISYIVGKSIA